jgi:hypothetical protein
MLWLAGSAEIISLETAYLRRWTAADKNSFGFP